MGGRRTPARIGQWPDYTPAMKNARFLLALVALALLLSGCGNKGPLVHPDDAPDRAENS
jgi:hypothetical protein